MPFQSRVKWKKEIENLKLLAENGKTFAEAAEKYGVTRQRIHQVVDKYFPDWYKIRAEVDDKKRQSVFEGRASAHARKYGTLMDDEFYKIYRHKFQAKKANAIRSGMDWSIYFGELTFPTHCPILGIELDYFAEGRQENSPSFDRLDNSRGYESGNVFIISWRANRIKNNGTKEEHRMIYEYLDKQSKVTVEGQE